MQKSKRGTKTTQSRDASAAGTVSRVAKLLACIAEADDEVSIKYLCQVLNLPASTVHRLLNLLTEEAIIEPSPKRGLYGPGLELVRVSSLIMSKFSIADLAKPIMREIVEECDQVCVLLRYIPTSRKVMPVHAEYSSNPLRYQIDLFQPYSLLWGATGRVVLAFLQSDEIEAALQDDESSPVTGARPPSRKAMMKELADIRERGYAITQNQKIPGAVGFAAPLFSSTARVMGCLSITIPKTRFNQKAEAAIVKILLAHTAVLNRKLGFDGRLPQK